MALLSPAPPRLASAILPQSAHFWVAKGLHVSIYALLGGAICFLSTRWKWRVVLWLALVLHGFLTEYLQQFVEGRSGQLSDVGLDAAGILLGLTAGLTWRRFKGLG